MNFKKTLLITSIITTVFSGMANAAPGNANASGTIHFKGQFIDSTGRVFNELICLNVMFPFNEGTNDFVMHFNRS